MSSSDEKISAAARLLREARKSTALTGAGVSVPSGIPDFRSPGSGLWEKYDPMEAASINAFRSNPEIFYDWIRPLLEKTRAARPNPAHDALTRLQVMGRLDEIITQNIDGLHESAGSRDVLAVHGHTRTSSCLNCARGYDSEPLWERVLAGDLPRCENCNQVLKPDVVFFGEMLPADIMARAEFAAGGSDVMLVAGSSLEVFPAADLPMRTLRNGGKVIIINKGPTMLDSHAHIKLEADVATTLPAIAEALAP